MSRAKRYVTSIELNKDGILRRSCCVTLVVNNDLRNTHRNSIDRRERRGRNRAISSLHTSVCFSLDCYYNQKPYA